MNIGIQKATGDFPTKKEGRPNQKLYVARADKSSLFKVGISNDPKSRLREMQVGSSARLLVVKASAASIEHEREAHRLLAPWHSHGEWFDLGSRAEPFVRRVRASVGIENLLATLRAVDTLESTVLKKYKYNQWDEGLGSAPFDDPEFFAAHARRSNQYCLDCDADTLATGEYYKVFENIWYAAIKTKAPRRHTDHPVRGMLCIGCLEARIRRQLRPSDFCDCSLNDGFDANKSKRLLARLGRPSGDCQIARPRET
jgi:T5orf172 domain